MKGKIGTPTQMEHMNGKQRKDFAAGQKIRAKIKAKREAKRKNEVGLKDMSGSAPVILVKRVDSTIVLPTLDSGDNDEALVLTGILKQS